MMELLATVLGVGFVALVMLSMCRAAAERKMAPTLVVSTMPSSTATRRAPWQMSSMAGSCGRRMAHRIPRVRG